jgi:hypothetical protein
LNDIRIKLSVARMQLPMSVPDDSADCAKES